MAQFLMGDDLSSSYGDCKAKDGAKLFIKAEAALNEEDHEEALSQGEKAVKEFKSAKFSNGVADALRVVIAAHRLSVSDGKRPEEAIKTAKEQKDSFSSDGDKRGEACMSLSLAEINTDLRGSKKREEGLKQAKDARDLFREVGDKRMEAVACICLANLNSTKVDKLGSAKACKEAQVAAADAVTIYTELEDKKGEGKALCALGVARCQGEAFQDGMKALKKGLNCFKEADDKKLIAFALMTIAEFNLRRGGPTDKDALPFAEEGMALLKEISYEKHGWPENALGMVVAAHMARDDVDKAEEVVKEGLEAFKEAGNKKAEAVVCDAMTSIHLRRGEVDDALTNADAALAIHKELENKRGEANAQMTIAQIHMRKNSKEGNDAALAAVQEALTILTELKDTKGQAQAKVLLCNVNLSDKNNNDALDLAKEAQKIYQEKDNQTGEAFALLAVGAAQLACDDKEEAVGAVVEAQKMFEKEGDKNGEAYALQMEVEIHMSKGGDPSKALTAATKARQLRNKTGDKSGEVELCLQMAQAIFACSEVQMVKGGKRRPEWAMDKALKAAKEGLSIARKVGSKDLIVGCIFMVGQAQGMLAKYQDALKTIEEGKMMCQDAGDKKGEAAAALVSAMVHFANGKLDKANDAANSGLTLSKRAKDSEGENIANYLLDLFNPQVMYSGGYEMGAIGGGDVADSGGGAGAELAPYSGPTADDLRPKIMELSLSLLGTDDVHSDTPLMDAGLDSLSMVQFRNTLAQQFTGVSMPASLIFDHPSASSVSEYIAGELKDSYYRGS